MDDEPNMTFVMFTWSEWVLFNANSAIVQLYHDETS